MRLAQTPRVPRFGEAGGFSLVEVLVGGGVLSVAITGLAQLFVVASQANVRAREMTYATVLATQKIEELRAAVFPEPTAGELAESLDARGRVLADGSGARQAAFERRWTIEPLAAYPADAVVVAVAVSRMGSSGDRAVRLTTVRARKAPGAVQ